MSAAIENTAAKTELGMSRAKASPAATLLLLLVKARAASTPPTTAQANHTIGTSRTIVLQVLQPQVSSKSAASTTVDAATCQHEERPTLPLVIHAWVGTASQFGPHPGSGLDRGWRLPRPE